MKTEEFGITAGDLKLVPGLPGPGQSKLYNVLKPHWSVFGQTIRYLITTIIGNTASQYALTYIYCTVNIQCLRGQ